MTWTEEKVNTLVESFGLPYAYYQFPEGTAQETPFVCFFYPDNPDFYADDRLYMRRKTISIELYTSEKDWDTEALVEDALAKNELAFSKEETWLASEQMHMVSYDMTVLFETPDTEGDLNDEQQS